MEMLPASQALEVNSYTSSKFVGCEDKGKQFMSHGGSQSFLCQWYKRSKQFGYSIFTALRSQKYSLTGKSNVGPDLPNVAFLSRPGIKSSNSSKVNRYLTLHSPRLSDPATPRLGGNPHHKGAGPTTYIPLQINLMRMLDKYYVLTSKIENRERVRLQSCSRQRHFARDWWTGISLRMRTLFLTSVWTGAYLFALLVALN